MDDCDVGLHTWEQYRTFQGTYHRCSKCAAITPCSCVLSKQCVKPKPKVQEMTKLEGR
jgi:hypothetical protein